MFIDSEAFGQEKLFKVRLEIATKGDFGVKISHLRYEIHLIPLKEKLLQVVPELEQVTVDQSDVCGHGGSCTVEVGVDR